MASITFPIGWPSSQFQEHYLAITAPTLSGSCATVGMGLPPMLLPSKATGNLGRSGLSTAVYRGVGRRVKLADLLGSVYVQNRGSKEK